MGLFGNSKGIVIWDMQTMPNERPSLEMKGEKRRKLVRVVFDENP